jgi:hypothetical protein
LGLLRAIGKTRRGKNHTLEHISILKLHELKLEAGPRNGLAAPSSCARLTKPAVSADVKIERLGFPIKQGRLPSACFVWLGARLSFVAHAGSLDIVDEIWFIDFVDPRHILDQIRSPRIYCIRRRRMRCAGLCYFSAKGCLDKSDVILKSI